MAARSGNGQRLTDTGHHRGRKVQAAHAQGHQAVHQRPNILYQDCQEPEIFHIQGGSIPVTGFQTVFFQERLPINDLLNDFFYAIPPQQDHLITGQATIAEDVVAHLLFKAERLARIGNDRARRNPAGGLPGLDHQGGIGRKRGAAD